MTRLEFLKQFNEKQNELLKLKDTKHIVGFVVDDTHDGRILTKKCNIGDFVQVNNEASAILPPYSILKIVDLQLENAEILYIVSIGGSKYHIYDLDILRIVPEAEAKFFYSIYDSLNTEVTNNQALVATAKIFELKHEENKRKKFIVKRSLDIYREFTEVKISPSGKEYLGVEDDSIFKIVKVTHLRSCEDNDKLCSCDKQYTIKSKDKIYSGLIFSELILVGENPNE